MSVTCIAYTGSWLPCKQQPIVICISRGRYTTLLTSSCSCGVGVPRKCGDLLRIIRGTD